MRWRTVLIIVAAAGLYALGNGRIHLWDRDEPRYAQCSREMMLSGDWVVPHYLREWRVQKPPLIYWLQATSMTLLGDNPASARLVSVVSMTAVLVLLAVVVGRLAGTGRGMWTTLIMASSLMVIVSAKMCLTDATLLLWITIGQLCLLAIVMGRGSWGISVIFGAALGLGLLTKGPLALAVPATTMAALALLTWIDSRTAVDRRGSLNPLARWLMSPRFLVALGLALAIALPWVLMVHQRAPGFLSALIGQAEKHATSPNEGHKGPPGYYMASLVFGTFPWSVLSVPVVLSAWRHRRVPAIRFAIAAAVGPLVLIELVPGTKLPHYALPIYPALAFVTADALVRILRSARMDIGRRRTISALRVGVGVMVVLSLAPVAALLFISRPTPKLPLLALCAAGLAGAVWILVNSRQLRVSAAAFAMGAAAMFYVAVLSAVAVPSVPFIRTSEQLAAVLAADGADGRISFGDAIMLQYKEPSLAYYQGGKIREERNNSFLADTPPARWPRWAVAPQDIWLALPPQVREQFEILDEVEGFAYNGRPGWIRIVVARRKS